MLNCNANVIPRLSAGGECQALRAKAIVEQLCSFDKGRGRDLLQGRPSARRGVATPADQQHLPACPEPLPLWLASHPGKVGRPSECHLSSERTVAFLTTKS